MFRNIFFSTKKDTIHLWETIRGENVYTETNWVPYVFTKAKGGNIKTIKGEEVKKREFQTYRDYYQYCKDKHNIFENKVKPEIQFLAERYHNIKDEDLEVPKLLVYHLDIEVHPEKGFPKASEAKDPIVLISVRGNQTITFGTKPYSGEANTNYVLCNDV